MLLIYFSYQNFSLASGGGKCAKSFFFAIPSSQRETFRVFLLSPLTEGRLSQTPVEELQREKGKRRLLSVHIRFRSYRAGGEFERGKEILRMQALFLRFWEKEVRWATPHNSFFSRRKPLLSSPHSIHFLLKIGSNLLLLPPCLLSICQDCNPSKKIFFSVVLLSLT